ncbi:MAG: aminotransferase class III-fold pyridoxal phosphate-dependent enzyme, partial [Hyphomicrobium sp.]|nr:aminotransferase class III-fold pyridoxal phosphate-dependent enzyme [Hyphomicrobium sp.]
RTGNMFGSQTFGMTPDTVSMAKAITSAYMPLGAVTVPEHVYQAMVDESKKLGMFAHGFTYSGHPVASAVAVKTLEIYERIDIVGHVQKVAPTVLKRLTEFDSHPLVGETRGVGLLGGIELVKDKRSRQSFDPRQGVGAKVSVFAQDEGLICRAVGGDTIALCPPLVISTEQVNTMFDRMARALDRGLDWARKEGIVG